MIAQAALIEIGEILENKDKQAVLRDYETHFVDSILQQYKVINYKPFQSRNFNSLSD